jgi:Family of unknown function (DUF5999)
MSQAPPPRGPRPPGEDAACRLEAAQLPGNGASRPALGAPFPGGGPKSCPHAPPCPPPHAPGRQAARVIASHPEQGWSLLCNGVVVFDDTGTLLPDGSVIEPDYMTCEPGNTGTTQAGHARTVASVPAARARERGLRGPGRAAGTALATSPSPPRHPAHSAMPRDCADGACPHTPSRAISISGRGWPGMRCDRLAHSPPCRPSRPITARRPVDSLVKSPAFSRPGRAEARPWRAGGIVRGHRSQSATRPACTARADPASSAAKARRASGTPDAARFSRPGSGGLPTGLQSSAADYTHSGTVADSRVNVRKDVVLTWVKSMAAHRARRRAAVAGRIA